ncbi:MAG: hypothetical protein HZA50_14225 [Planctomycetes bacterium]|nr:hypothetical protein [Planctomycetota bacterium]
MIQCKDCELFRRKEDGQMAFDCDPFTNVKEPECILKWQLLKINQMVAGYEATLSYYHKLAPMQEKMFKYMEREIEDVSETDNWKYQDEDENAPEDEDEPGREKWQ